MRIAFLSPFFPFRGGIAQFSDRLYIELNKNNEIKAFSFKTLYPDFLFPGKTQFVDENVSNIDIESERVLSSINPLSYISTAKKINKYKPDILIVAYWMSFLAPALGSLCKLIDKDIKIVSLVHNAIPHEQRFFDKICAKYFFRKCHGFIALSTPVQNDLENLLLTPKILLSPHPIYDNYGERMDKNTARQSLKLFSDKKTLLFFGLIREYKGLDLLIEAMSFLDDSYQLVIAGESYEDFGKYQNLINRSILKNNIQVFEQYIPDEMVTLLFSASDLLVLPYRSATQSGVIAIAYQLELPMVATKSGALGDTILLAGTGIVVDEICPKYIAKGIKMFFENQSKQTEYIANIKLEKKRLSWEHLSNAIIDFVENKV